jgi:cellulase
MVFRPDLCAHQQLNIVNGGSVSPSGSELVKFPGAYSDSDPGLGLNVYSTGAQTQTCYTIPGPPLYSGASATVSSLPACGGAASGTATGTKTSTSAGSAPSCSASMYSQCGGTGACSRPHRASAY